MPMTDEERFRFDLTGFLVRPAILDPVETAAIVDQIDRISDDRESLAPEHRAIPGGPASLLIDHPKVIEVLHEIIGPDIRLESCGHVRREKGQRHGELHGGGPFPDHETALRAKEEFDRNVEAYREEHGEYPPNFELHLERHNIVLGIAAYLAEHGEYPPNVEDELRAHACTYHGGTCVRPCACRANPHTRYCCSS